MPDYVPANDDAFDHFINVLLGPAVNNAGNPLHLTPAQIAAFNAKQTAWTVAWPAYLAIKPTYEGALLTKNQTRTDMAAEARVINGLAQANPDVDDLAKSNAGLPIHKTTHTPVGPPLTAPVLYKVDNEHLVQFLWFSDSSTPGHKAKPHGVTMLEIRESVVAMGAAAPLDAAAMPFLTNATKTPHRNVFDAAELGHMAYYAARWINTKGVPGPWSAITGYIVN